MALRLSYPETRVVVQGTVNLASPIPVTGMRFASATETSRRVGKVPKPPEHTSMPRFDLDLLPGADSLAGSALGDLFVEKASAASARTLAGLGGDDSYQLESAGPDVILEEANGGTDTVFSAYASFTLPDFVERLVLDTFLERASTEPAPTAVSGIGNALANRITGNALANVLDGKGGADTMDGGGGNDTYRVDAAGDRIIDSAGTDLVESLVAWTLGRDLENLTLLAGAGAVNATGNDLPNVLTGNDSANAVRGLGGSDTMRGNGGTDTFYGGSGDDTYADVNPEDVVVESASGGNDHVYAFAVDYTLPANVENLTLGDPDLGINGPGVFGRGNALHNGIGGNGRPNVLYGYGGDDNLAGGLDLDLTDPFFDDDTMIGGTGNDLYEVDSPDDLVLELAGEGNDLIEARISFSLPAWVEDLTLLADATAVNGLGNDLSNRIIGNAGANRLEGHGGNDFITAGDGNDTLDGSRGDDRLDGGGGTDSMTGGAGNDTYQVDSLLDVVVEDADGGVDEVAVQANTSVTVFVLFDDVERMLLTGSSATQQGRGNALDNFIAGASSNDLLDGAAGNDTLSGGGGDDTYVVDSTGDRVIELANEGKDTLRAGISVTALAAALEDLELTGSSDLAGTGNAQGNGITGNSGANLLSGLAGDDRLVGAAGADTLNGGTGDDRLDGGTGADSLNGGAGNDTYFIDDAGDVVAEAAGGGLDLVFSTVSLDLAVAGFTQVEAASLTGSANANLSGNTLANALTGNSGNNLISGGAGNDWLSGGAAGTDTLRGGAGNDTYHVVAADTMVDETGGDGRDMVTTTLAAWTLALGVEDLRMMATSAVTATGNAAANRITTRSGADALDGGAGADTLDGSEGDDTYQLDTALDVVIERAGGGNDLAVSSASVALAAHVERLQLTGTGALNGTGNGLDNALTGNAGSNVLDGGAGNDTIDGGAGADTLRGGLGNDRFDNVDSGDVVSGGAGTDTVATAASVFTLGADVENLEFTGTGAQAGTGNALANRMSGGEGDDTLSGLGGNDYLDGGEGDDSMDGGLGNDSYVIDSAGDVVTDAGGIDTIVSDLAATTLTGALAGFENLSALGNVAFAGTGNALANRLVGSGLDDTLDGGAGADTMAGGDGSDVYFVDSTADQVVERKGEGFADEVRSSVSYALGEHLEILTLQGAANLSGTGNSQDNLITGNAGNNVLAGGAGNDLIDGGGGNDSLSGGAGNDLMVWNGGDTVSGGAGDDTLLVTAATLNLQTLADTVITGVEYLDLRATGADVTVRATLADILALSDSNRVIVDGGAGDALQLVDPAGAATWTNVGEDMIGGILYDVYEAGLAQVFVDTDVAVTIV